MEDNNLTNSIQVEEGFAAQIEVLNELIIRIQDKMETLLEQIQNI
jgi:hypothetical protein